MKARLLVVYSQGRNGREAAAAQAVGEALRFNGAEVEARPGAEVADASVYDSTVVVAPLIQGFWSSEATDFIRRHRLALAYQAVAYLLTHGPEVAVRDEGALLRKALGPVLRRYNEIVPVGVKLVRLDRSAASLDEVRAWAASLRPNFIDEDGSSPSGIRKFLDPTNPSSAPSSP